MRTWKKVHESNKSLQYFEICVRLRNNGSGLGWQMMPAGTKSLFAQNVCPADCYPSLLIHNSH